MDTFERFGIFDRMGVVVDESEEESEDEELLEESDESASELLDDEEEDEEELEDVSSFRFLFRSLDGKLDACEGVDDCFGFLSAAFGSGWISHQRWEILNGVEKPTFI